MKFISTRLSVVTILLFAAFFLKAQTSPAVYIDDQAVQSEATFALDVKVLGYTDIISSAFTVEWDTTHLVFAATDNLPNFLSNDNFNLDSVSIGRITFLYFDMSLAGNTLLDQEVLFTINMQSRDFTEDVMTEVIFGGIKEVVDTSEQVLNIDYNGATVSLETVNTTEASITEQFLNAELLQNPFSDRAIIDLTLAQGGSLNWELADINGQVINTGKQTYATGQHRLVLENTLFKHAGNYVLTLEMDGYSVSKKLLYVVP